MVDEKSMYERCMEGMNEEFEQRMAATFVSCPWMTGDDQQRARRVLAGHFGLIEDGKVDLDQMVTDVVALINRSEVVEDAHAMRAFYELYAEVCTVYRLLHE